MSANRDQAKPGEKNGSRSTNREKQNKAAHASTIQSNQGSAANKAEPAKSKKSNAQRAKKRAAARKVRKTKLLTLLRRYDIAIKQGNTRSAAQALAAFKKDKVSQYDIPKIRSLTSAQNEAEISVQKQTARLESLNKGGDKSQKPLTPQRLKRELSETEKRLDEAVRKLKKAQTEEQTFFAALIKKQTKNRVCPYCSLKLISIDSHVMDMHAPRWGEYLTLLGSLK